MAPGREDLCKCIHLGIHASALRHGEALAKRIRWTGYPPLRHKLFRIGPPLLNSLFTLTLKSLA
jgi:hypothetical protein